MCDGADAGTSLAAAVPRSAPGAAVDPIAVEPVDEVVVTTLVDDFFDALLTGAAAVPDWAQGSCGTRYTLTAA